MRDPGFLRFLERIGQEAQASFTTEDLIILDLVHRERTVAERLRPRLQRLRDLGIIETHGKGRGVHSFFSRRFYSFVGQPPAPIFAASGLTKKRTRHCCSNTFRLSGDRRVPT